MEKSATNHTRTVVNNLRKRIIKYGIISLIGIYLIFQFLPVGDYCSGLGNFLSSLFIIGLLILIVFVLAIRNLIRIKKRKEKFDFIPLIITLFFGLIWYFLVDMTDKKFWTEKSLIGFVEEEGTPKSGTLVLFKNGSFGASYHRADYSCTYQGDYEIIDNRLTLKRTDLTEVTDSIFTTKYMIVRKDSILKPIENGFVEIGISKMAE
ncbi:hypothetical protein CJ263_16075 [Maribacter cobaltidurans]|uniref:Uncharacterized protein n=1 Tax=Maribacter cobaltidurans TaxID=1178778 RepID=A0A223V9S9_9FLAO|nr:hypothetical protein CJ263_16075 [Maribacter cobaltidurans]